MKILGIDPGTIITGWGVIQLENSHFKAIDYGCIKPPAKEELFKRYLIIFNSVEDLINKFKPDAVAIESQFVSSKNVQIAIKLGMARGSAIIAAAKKEIPIFEYAPRNAKKAVTGTGAASKQQVQGMVRKLLNLAEVPQPEDAADALAIAICHANSLTKRSLLI